MSTQAKVSIGMLGVVVMAVVVVLLIGVVGAGIPGIPGVGGEEWEGMDGAALAAAAEELKAEGLEGEAGRMSLAAYVDQQYVQNPEEAGDVEDSGGPGALSLKEWEGIVDGVRGEMDEGMKERWRGALREEYAGRAMDAGELGTVLWVLNLLGDEGQNDFAATWVQGPRNMGEWQTWPMEELVTLGKCLGHGYWVNENVEQARRMVGSFILGTHFNGNAATIDVPGHCWMALVKCYGQSLTQEEREAWLNGLAGVYGADEETIRSLHCEDAIMVGRAIQELGQMYMRVARSPERVNEFHRKAGVIGERWLTGRRMEELEGMSPEQLSEFTFIFDHWEVRLAEMKRILEMMGPGWEDAEAAGQLKVGDYWGMARTWSIVENPEEAARWARMAMGRFMGTEAAREAVTVDELKGLASVLHMGEVIGHGEEWPEFAEAIAAKGRTGELDVLPDDVGLYVSETIVSAGSRAVVQEALFDEGGKLHPGVAKILARSYAMTGELDVWQSYVEGLAADARAMGRDGVAQSLDEAWEYAEGLKP